MIDRKHERKHIPVEDRRRRYEQIVELRGKGMTLEAIGEQFGLSRARVSAILKTGEPGITGKHRNARSETGDGEPAV